MLQNITREPEHVRDQFGDNERIWSPALEESFGIRAILFIDNENDMVSGWELLNLTYNTDGDFRLGSFDKHGNSVPCSQQRGMETTEIYPAGFLEPRSALR